MLKGEQVFDTKNKCLAKAREHLQGMDNVFKSGISLSYDQDCTESGSKKWEKDEEKCEGASAELTGARACLLDAGWQVQLTFSVCPT